MSGAILPPNGNLVSKYDRIVFPLADAPKEWKELERRANPNVTKLKRRYGKDFEFTTRTDEPTRVLWGRYVGQGDFDPNKFYADLAPFGVGSRTR